MSKGETIRIAVVDDHQLFRDGLISLIEKLNLNFKVISASQNGKLFLEKIEAGLELDLVLLDLNMPVMDGFTTVQKLQENHPDVKCLVLTMKDDDITLIKLLKAGARGFLNKDAEPETLEEAILSIHEKGFYYSELVTNKLVGALRSPNTYATAKSKLNGQELQFLQLACSEYTYKEIANIMCLSVKTIDGYRAKLFEKLNIKSRVGLVLFAIQNKIVALE
ncbi:MAG: response regulator transcription factor [Flavobacteriales bacterium]|nr:response regulator transcription factor [Flavobacteriales bacterium]